MRLWGKRTRTGSRDERAGLSQLAGTALLERFAQAYPHATFVDIGSNDGQTHDHVLPFAAQGKWRGVLVEPVPSLYDRLRAAYSGYDGLSFENAAVAEADGTVTLHRLAEPEDAELEWLPYWYDAIGSLRRDVLVRHAQEIPDIESRITTLDVPAVTFQTLCARHGIQQLDLLAVDTEGYDYEILRTIDFDTVRPRLVIYEHYHLSRADREACLEYLSSHGYETMEEGFDTWCLEAVRDDALSRYWHELAPAVPAAFHED